MSTVSVPNIPVVVIFVRHSPACRYRDDETYKNCKCRKHLRYTHDGKQERQSAKTRSWAIAENVKRELQNKFAAGTSAVTVEPEQRNTMERAIELFIQDKRNQNVHEDVVKKYDRELQRLRAFLRSRNKIFPNEVTADDLTEFRADWEKQYPSTHTRSRVLTRLRAFLRYCHNRQWIDRIPHLAGVKVEEPETLPLTEAEYDRLLKTIPNEFPADKARKVRALVRLMRHSGLAIRDAVTLEREEVVFDPRKKIYRIVTRRTKTGTHVSVVIPLDVAKEVMTTANGNKRFIFWSTGNGKEQSAVTNWQHDLRAAFRAAGLPNGHPHQLRDTFAVGLLKAGVPIEEVSRALGHESIKTTERHYAAWIQARQDRLDTLIMGTWKKPRSKKA